MLCFYFSTFYFIFTFWDQYLPLWKSVKINTETSLTTVSVSARSKTFSAQYNDPNHARYYCSNTIWYICMEKKIHPTLPHNFRNWQIHCILSISLCNGAETSKFYVLAFVPVWGCFLLDFSYDFMNIVIFPPPEKKPGPTCTPYPTEGSKSSKSVEKNSKIVCCQLLADFLG